MDIGELLKNTVGNIPPRDGPNIEFEFQLLGVEMESHFGKQFKKNIWPLFHKKEYPLWVIKEAWKEYGKHKDKPFRYFMAILINKSKNR